MTGIIDFYCITAVQRTQNVCNVPVFSPKKQIIIVLFLDMHCLLVILLSNQIKRENVLLRIKVSIKSLLLSNYITQF